MTEAAQRGAFGGQGAAVVRVDLDDVAVGAGFVAIVVGGAGAFDGNVEAGEFVVHFAGVTGSAFPLVLAAGSAHANAALVLGAGAFVDENARPVLFAGQVGAPRGIAVAAVVVGATAVGASSGVFGLDVVGATQRAGDLHA